MADAVGARKIPGLSRCRRRKTIQPNPTQNKQTMQLTKILTAIALAFTMTGSIFAADGKIKEGSCCDKAKKAGKECSHKCCVEATKAGKVCEKCNK
jgi:hypothetical protein